MYKPENKVVNIETLINTLVETDKSTTKLLENFANNILNVELIRQFPFSIKKGEFLKRESLLFFYSLLQPVIYSESIINLYRLNTEQIEMLGSGNITIGRIFHNQVITKRNITVEQIPSRLVKEKLHSNSSEFYCKQYDMFINDDPIGIIKEYFCKETIQRIEQHQ